MMFYGLDALMHGGIAGLFAFPPALLLFWNLTVPLNAGALALRPIVAISAAFGLAQLPGSVWALSFERTGFADEAMAGTLIVSFGVALLAFPVLLLLRWRQRRLASHSSPES